MQNKYETINTKITEQGNKTGAQGMINLQPIKIENVRRHYKWNNDREISYYDSEYPHTFENFDSFLTRMKRMIENPNRNSELFEIVDLYDEEVIGVIDVYGIDYHNKRCFVSCTIGDKSYRGRGYGKKSLELILEYCFNSLKMNKVGATSFDFNETWIRILEKAGFRKEGELRNHVMKANEYRNKLIFSILKKEFSSLHLQKKSTRRLSMSR